MKIRFVCYLCRKIEEFQCKRLFRILARKMQRYEKRITRQMCTEMKDLTNIPKVELIRDKKTLTKIFRSRD
jgi:hypothetical protein